MAESFNDGIGDNEAYIRREEHWDHVNGRARRSNSTYDEAMQFNLNPRNEGHRAVESANQRSYIEAATKMSARGGRGGFARGGLKGATWEHDPGVKLESAPSELFPKHPNLVAPAPLTNKERRQVDLFKQTKEKVKRGPAYTEPTKRDPDAPAKTFGEDQFNKQYGGNSKADIDPFTAVETYSSKYKPKKRTLPDIKNMKLDKNLFPKELWGTLSDSEGEEVREDLARIAKKKAAVIGGLKGTAKGTTDRSAAERNAIVLEKIKQATGGEEDAEEVEDDEISNVSEHDDDYEDEEDGGDYDAEAYFDDGEKEEDEGEVGGGEDY